MPRRGRLHLPTTSLRGSGETIKLNGWINTYNWGTRVGLRIDNWKPDPNYQPREKPTYPREVRGEDEIPF